MAFSEERFNTEIRYGFVGGPQYSTDVVGVASGYEQRNSNWLDSRGVWRLGDDILEKAEWDALTAFFKARKGMADGFRMKDWGDFECSIVQGVLVASDATPSTCVNAALNKRYTSTGGSISDRPIKKPVPGQHVAYINSAVDSGATFNTVNGTVTFSATTKAITAITKANPGVVTAVGHGFSTSDKIWITGVGGMIEVNNLLFTITFVDVDRFSIGVNTTSYTTYTSLGSAIKYPAVGALLQWSGQFDVPARFNTDKLDGSFDAYRNSDGERLMNVTGLEIVELRL